MGKETREAIRQKRLDALFKVVEAAWDEGNIGLNLSKDGGNLNIKVEAPASRAALSQLVINDL